MRVTRAAAMKGVMRSACGNAARQMLLSRLTTPIFCCPRLSRACCLPKVRKHAKKGANKALKKITD